MITLVLVKKSGPTLPLIFMECSKSGAALALQAPTALKIENMADGWLLVFIERGEGIIGLGLIVNFFTHVYVNTQ